MRPMERVPAVRRIETDRADAFAVEITGEFVAADAENLCGLLEGAYTLHERIDLLVRIVELESLDVSGVSADTTAFMRDHVARHVGRCAIIDDGGWTSRLAGLLAPGSGVELRRFSEEQEQDAWAWIGARATDGS